MKIRKLASILFMITLALLIGACSASSGINGPDNTYPRNSFDQISGTVTPEVINPSMTVSFTYVPPYKTSYDLKGKVSTSVNPALFKIAVYIYVPGWGYVSKPYINNPYTAIKTDRTWICDITTGGNDIYAARIYAFLINKSYNAPVILRASSLPSELFSKCSNYTYVNR